MHDNISANLFIVIATYAHNKLTLKTTSITLTLSSATPDLIPPTLWPPNSPDLNPVDYKLWSAMEERVYRSKVEMWKICVDAFCRPGMNLISAFLIKQSVNGVRNFVFVSMRLADKLNSNFDW